MDEIIYGTRSNFPKLSEEYNQITGLQYDSGDLPEVKMRSKQREHVNKEGQLSKHKRPLSEPANGARFRA
jgi:hypothetical protein